MNAITRDGDDLILRLRIQPRASRDEFAELMGDRLRVRITAPPVDGKANGHLLKWLAKQFGVPRKQIMLETGDSNRDKRIRVIDPRTVPETVAKTLSH